MKHYVDQVLNGAGAPISGATVAVHVANVVPGAGALASIFSDDGVTAKANPVTTDGTGTFDFYVADGRYDFVVTVGTTTKTVADLEIADQTESQVGDASAKFGTVNYTTALQHNAVAIQASDMSNGVTGSGAIVLASSPTIASPSITGQLKLVDGSPGAPAYSFAADTGTGFWRGGAGAIFYAANTIDQILLQSNLFRSGSGMIVGFSSNADPGVAASDTNLTRGAAGILQIGTGETANASGTIRATNLQMSGTGLPFITNDGTGGIIFSLNGGAAVPKFDASANLLGVGTVRVADGSGASPSISFTTHTGTGFGLITGFNAIFSTINGVISTVEDGAGIRLSAGLGLGWTPANASGGSSDTGFSRISAAVSALGNGNNGDASGTLALANIKTSAGTSLAIPTAGANVISDSATQTLTAKRVTPRQVTMADATSVTPTSDTADINTFVSSQVSGTLTVNAPSGTPTDGQKLVLRLKSANAQTYSFNATYAFSTTVTAPTTLAAGKTDYIGLMWNATNTKWDVVAVDQGH